MNAIRAAAAVLALCLAVPGPLPAREETAPDREPAANETARRETFARLERMRIDLDFEDTLLEEVIDFVRDFASVNIVLSPGARGREGEEGPVRVSIRLRDVPVGTALRLVLEPHGLVMQYRDGVLLVRSRAEAAEDVVLRHYDVRDLLVVVQDFAPPKLELAPPESGIMGPVIILPEEKEPPITGDEIVRIIRASTAGGDWDGTPGATIQFTGGLLVVNQTEAVHDEIVRLLGGLRATR